MKILNNIRQAAEVIRRSEYTVVFTGAGISAESGLPTFRGEGGIWKEVDPNYFNIDFFHKKPGLTWEIIKKVFYDQLMDVKPNLAHHVLSVMGQQGIIQSIITQNIDHLHQEAGCKKVIELHGTYRRLVCTKCSTEYDYTFADLKYLPPTCFVCGEVYPANTLPQLAKERGATIIEVNLNPSPFTDHYTDIFLNTGAVTAMKQLCRLLSCRVSEEHQGCL